jgi:type IV pilus assembly protein PilC
VPTFTFNARDINGQAITGTLTGSDERMIREQLRSKNLYVTRLQTEGASQTAAGARAGLFTARVKLYDLVIFSRQFATLISAGLTITESLDALGEQTRNETLRQVILEMNTDIRGGATLTDSMKKHPRVFNELYISLVEAGEMGGLLEKTLDTAAVALDTEMEIREKVKSAFVYPIAVIVTATGVVTFLLAYVVPVFAAVYKQFRAELPGITKLLIIFSEILTRFWWVGILAVILATIVTIRAYKTYKGRRFLDGIKTRLPLFGHLIEKIGHARLAHTLSALTEAGVPLIRALGTAGRVSGNALVMDAMGDVSVKIQQGVNMGLAMSETRRFPLLMTRMIAAGEESGNLGEMLEQVARFFDREVDYGVKRLMTLIEPVLTVFLGLLVGFILLALYLPIFNLGNVIK